MVIWMRWHCPPDTEFEIRALEVWRRARYLSVTEAPEYLRVSGGETFLGNVLFLWNLNARAEDETRDLRLSKQAALNTVPAPPP